MNKIENILIILIAIAFLCPAVGQADIVYVKDEDRLVGIIQNPAFTVQTPYGNIRIKTEFLKSIDFKDGAAGQWIIETVNNDQFSGRLLNANVQFIQKDGRKRTIDKGRITRIWREFRAQSRQATTTIITMKNNDRFSGKFLDTSLEIRANFITKTIQPKNINRLEFADNYQDGTEILLENGDLITGILKQDQFRVAPESVSEITVDRTRVKSIQFNAPKMILKTFGGTALSEADGDGDGIPDYADLCMDTPAGAEVGMDGCARRSNLAQAANRQKINGHQRDAVAALAKTDGQFQNVLFDFDRAELKSQYYSTLDEAAEMLNRSPMTQAEIHGHTDSIGTQAYNQTLSEKRARTVEQYLVQKGIEGDRLLSKGFGFTVSSASNENEASRALNRRVEILLVPDQKRLAYQNQN
ncbi:MAG: OmpA family protein [Desulfobacterales bacterium]|nr:OmpA family protein [Desulfobacterales bacterium]